MKNAFEFIVILLLLMLAAPIMWVSWKVFGPVIIMAALAFALLKIFNKD